MAKDIKINDENELIIENGDFVIDESDNQNVHLIIEAEKGEIRSSPELGFGIIKKLKKTGRSIDFLREMKIELGKDGYNKVDITVNQDTKELNFNIK